MQLSYKLLISISFQHTYFKHKNFSFFKVVLEKETDRVLLRHGLVCKQYASGFRILYDVAFCGRQRTWEEVIACALKLRFYLDNTDPHLFNYTASCYKQAPAETTFYFSNRKENKFNDRLHSGEYADAGIDSRPTVEVSDTGRLRNQFATLDIYTECITTEQYTIQFQSRKVYWRYVIVSEHLIDLPEISIINRKDSSAFEGPVEHRLPDGKKALLFTSKQPFSFSERPDKDLQLVEKYNPVTGRGKVVIGKLPNPDIRHLSVTDFTLSREDRRKYADVIL